MECTHAYVCLGPTPTRPHLLIVPLSGLSIFKLPQSSLIIHIPTEGLMLTQHYRLLLEFVHIEVQLQFKFVSLVSVYNDTK